MIRPLLFTLMGALGLCSCKRTTADLVIDRHSVESVPIRITAKVDHPPAQPIWHWECKPGSCQDTTMEGHPAANYYPKDVGERARVALQFAGRKRDIGVLTFDVGEKARREEVVAQTPRSHSPAAQRAAGRPAIVFTTVPPSNEKGGALTSETIAGNITGISKADCADLRLVFYSLTYVSVTGTYYVQPTEDAPFTSIDGDGDFSFSTMIHTGRRYFAVLVRRTYLPKTKLSPSEWPPSSPDVLAVTEARPAEVN